jgi:2'-5' RNA ligase
MSRLFLGTFLPEEVKARISLVQTNNSELGAHWQCRIRWVQPAKLHLTWLFLGEVDKERLGALEEAMAGLQPGLGSASELVYDRLEVWFGRGLPRHLVLVPSQLPPEFMRATSHVRTKLVDFVAGDFRQQARDQLRPHVTLMRFQKLDGKSHQLPVVAPANTTHPFVDRKNLRIKEISSEAIAGMAEVLPVHHEIDRVDIIGSNQVGDSHGYSIVKSFPLP